MLRHFAILTLSTALPLPSATGQDPARFPPLPPAIAGEVTLPLTQTPPLPWRAVGTGTALRIDDAGILRASWRRAPREAFGLALAFRAGGLPGLGSLRLRLSGDAPATLLVSLRDDAGQVFSWPMQRLGAGPLALELDADDLAPDPFQNGGRTPGEFAAERAVILSLTDIAGYLGGAPGEAGFALLEATARVGATAPAAAECASAAEATFFAALVDGDGTPQDAARLLLLDALQRPHDARPALLLGLAHLWRAAEGDHRDPGLVDELLLAERWLARAADLDPSEDRLPSWLVPARIAIARTFGDPGAIPALREPLLAAARRDPAFHGFAVGLLGYGAARDSNAFAAGLAALRATVADADPTDPSVRNEPRWPHNREGFLLFAASYEQRAGEAGRALTLLDRVEAIPSFADWPFRAEVEARRTAWRAGRDPDAGGEFMQRNACVVCHRAR
ncbi:MAG: hypothetical protein IPM29_18495 [Planctomycetes bacterium]|nr:hypothetical protein [Planctomycetota bacterium]